MTSNLSTYFLNTVLSEIPMAYAHIIGSSSYPELQGTIHFYPAQKGTLVSVEVDGLPKDPGNCPSNIFGFHIHEGSRCTGNSSDPFSATGSHYNPTNCPHPAHAGDMPPLFSNNGFAWMLFFTDRFLVTDIIGKTAVIHRHPDDFTSQPAGDAGEKIACGEIREIRRKP